MPHMARSRGADGMGAGHRCHEALPAREKRGKEIRAFRWLAPVKSTKDGAWVNRWFWPKGGGGGALSKSGAVLDKFGGADVARSRKDVIPMDEDVLARDPSVVRFMPFSHSILSRWEKLERDGLQKRGSSWGRDIGPQRVVPDFIFSAPPRATRLNLKWCTVPCHVFRPICLYMCTTLVQTCPSESSQSRGPLCNHCRQRIGVQSQSL
jgi:hypothetical protein